MGYGVVPKRRSDCSNLTREDNAMTEQEFDEACRLDAHERPPQLTMNVERLALRLGLPTLLFVLSMAAMSGLNP
jgi:hypothetical protein